MKHHVTVSPLKSISSGLVFLIILLSACPCVAPHAQENSAAAIFLNANMYTMDEAKPMAEALAVRGDRIIFVGDGPGAMVYRTPATLMIDLKGKTVIPGLIDAHGHVLSLGKMLQNLDFVGTDSAEDIRTMVLKECRRIGPGGWIYGRGWDQNDWTISTFPTMQDLRGTETNPVLLVRIDGHAYWVNRTVLEMAGITKDTPDPEGGRIMRDKKGKPTGVLLDNATLLINAIVPVPTHEDLVERALLAQQECLRLGLTGVGDAGTDSAGLEVYIDLGKSGKLKIRIAGMLDSDTVPLERYYAPGPQVGLFANHLTVRAIKVYADGALGSRGAALMEPYSDDPRNRGLVISDSDKIAGICSKALVHGFQVCTHAIGDWGNRLTLDAYEKALKANPVKDPRFRIEHAQVLSLADIPRFAGLGVIPSMQPTHATSDMHWAEGRVGPERIKGAYAWRTLLDTGVRIPLGSDFPIESPNPLLGIYSAVTRQNHAGWPEQGWYPEQRLTIHEAVRGFTLDAAYGAFEEDLKGSLEVGKLADMVVLSKDIFTISPKEILTTKVLMTIIGGEVVYGGE